MKRASSGRLAVVAGLVVACSGVCHGQDGVAGPGAGKARPPVPIVGNAPPLSLDGLLQAPAGTEPAAALSWDDFKGQVVVLEFWATWCGPCVAAIPHLNELAVALKDEPVRFLSVTDETEDKVRTFLGKREMKSWIGLDADKSTLKAYGIGGIPATFLIDRQGRVAGATQPDRLKEEHIRAVLAGRDPDLPRREAPADEPAAAENAPAPPPVFELVIRPTQQKGGASSHGPGYFTSESTTLAGLVAYAYEGYSDTETILPDGFDRTSCYSLRAKGPRERTADLREALRVALRAEFGVTARAERRETDIVVCTAPGGPGPGLVVAASQGSTCKTTSDSMHGVGLRFEIFLREIESLMKKPVIDETGVRGQFDATIKWRAGDDRDKLRAICEATGIVAREVRRPLEVLVVTQEKR